MKSIPKSRIKDTITDRSLGQTIDAVNYLLTQTIQPITISSSLLIGNNTINHSLGKIPTGWIVADTTGAAIIYRVSSDINFIVLNSSANTTVSLLIF